MNSAFSTARLEHLRFDPQARPADASPVIERRMFQAAESAIRRWPGYTPTPLTSLPALAERCSIASLQIKDEGGRFGLGSFKALGGAWAVQSLLQHLIAERLGTRVSLDDVVAGRYREAAAEVLIVTATDGNHGRSVAWGCQQFGARCRIFIHAGVSASREKAMADLGAEMIRIDGNYDASVAAAAEHAAQEGGWVVSDTSWHGYENVPRLVMAGYGVMAAEIVEQWQGPPPSHVFLQGGVGGLAAAVALRLRQDWPDAPMRVVVVEPRLADCLFQSARTGRASSVEITEETVMAGLSCGEPSTLAWAALVELASDFVRLDDALVAPTMHLLAHPIGDDPAMVLGESAVPGLSCVLAAAQREALAMVLGLDADSRVLLIGSEGATDEAIYRQMLESVA